MNQYPSTKPVIEELTDNSSRCISGNSVIMADSRKCQSHACADIWADVARLVCTARATEIEGQMIQLVDNQKSIRTATEAHV